MTWNPLDRKRRAMGLRQKRHSLEGRLKRCELQHTREFYMLKIENINILLQDMGLQAYPGKRHKATF